jgi:hypothetical protein
MLVRLTLQNVVLARLLCEDGYAPSTEQMYVVEVLLLKCYLPFCGSALIVL